jgi:hypothetical protein
MIKKGNYLDLQLKIQGLSDIIPKRDTTPWPNTFSYKI